MCRCMEQTVEGGGGGWTPIRFRTYNIRNVRNGRFALALREMSQVNADVEVYQETKFMEGIYTRKPSGYRVIATPSLSRHQGGVNIFY